MILRSNKLFIRIIFITDETFKIVILGETGVGKTSIISQYIDSIFQEDLQATTGGSFSSKTYTYDNGKLLKLEIWDTAGQERYRSLTKMFYKDAGAAVLVYDITSNFSFEELKNYWVREIKDNAPKDISKWLKKIISIFILIYSHCFGRK